MPSWKIHTYLENREKKNYSPQEEWDINQGTRKGNKKWNWGIEE